MPTTILVADNCEEYLNNLASYLEKEGFIVIKALNPNETRKKLESEQVQVAVIDLRLVDDSNTDLSGLHIALDYAPLIPKIIISERVSFHAAKSILEENEKTKSIIDFIDKSDGFESILRSIKNAITNNGKYLFKLSQNNISKQLNEDYIQARHEAAVHYKITICIILISLLIIFTGLYFFIKNQIGVGTLTVSCGTLIELINILFYKRLDVIQKRVDEFHFELLQTKRFQNLLASCYEIPNPDIRDQCIKNIIDKFTNCWHDTKLVQPRN